MAEPVPTNFLLPHEIDRAKDVVGDYKRQRTAAVSEVAEALQVTGDWYENGPVEAGREEATRMVTLAAPYVEALEKYPRVEYPDPTDTSVQPGSYVRTTFMGDLLGFMIVGLTTLYDRGQLPDDPEVEEVMLASTSLASALLGKTVGDHFEVTFDKRTLGGKILAIDQELVAQTYRVS
jgi:transcription elongation GreA/GreB family factor